MSAVDFAAIAANLTASPERPEPPTAGASERTRQRNMHPRRRLPDVERERLDRVVRELRMTHGLGHRSIAVVLDLYEGVPCTESHARTWCNELGLPKNPNKLHAFDHLHGRSHA